MPTVKAPIFEAFKMNKMPLLFYLETESQEKYLCFGGDHYQKLLNAYTSFIEKDQQINIGLEVEVTIPLKKNKKEI